MTFFVLLKSVRFVGISLFLIPLAMASKSSEIPDRREFPVNDAIQPCDDFYGYACSKVKEGFQLREDRSRHVFSFSDSHERLLKKKQEYLAGLAKGKKARTRRGRQLGTLFQACVDPEARKKEEKEIVRREMSAIFDIVERDDFLEFLQSRIDSGEFSFLGFSRIANADRPDRHDLYLVGTIQSLPERSYYDKSDVVRDFQSVVEAFFRTVKLDRPVERAKWVVETEKEFAQTYPLPAEWRELISKRTGIGHARLRKNYPAFRLRRFMKKIPARVHVRHMTPENFDSLHKILTEKPLDVLKSIYLYHALSGYMDDAYPEFFAKSFEFNRKHLGGPEKRSVREERCTKMIMSRFGKELDAEVLKILFPNFPEKKFRKLVEKVRQSIVDGMKSNTWLSKKTRVSAIDKINKARLQVVQPRNDREWYFNPSADYKKDTPLANLRTLDENLTKRTIEEFKKKRDPDIWWMSPLTINAYYSPPDNKFVMPIGILQYPFYDGNLSEEANLGAVGGVIGHELGHGIDDKGAKYDARGKLRDWFSKKDLEEFRKRGSRLVEYFDEIGHNGQLTLGENIGDLVGLSFAYSAAFPKGRVFKNDEEKKKLQREFFLQWGRVWCDETRPKYAEKLLKTDSHAAPWARVNMQMKHQPGFFEAYSCREGHQLFLKEADRVVIW